MDTATAGGRRRLTVVPATSAAPAPIRSERDEPASVPHVAVCARAVDDARAVRRALLGGHATTAAEHAIAVEQSLTALAAVLAEVHGDLDELAAHDTEPEGTA